jgi:hypothetical protein
MPKMSMTEIAALLREQMQLHLSDENNNAAHRLRMTSF